MPSQVIDRPRGQGAQSSKPGLRRVLDALGTLKSELETDKRRLSGQVNDDWRISFVAGQRSVIQHYRAVLATQRMPPAERQAVLDRIASIEAEIQSVQPRLEDAQWTNAA